MLNKYRTCNFQDRLGNEQYGVMIFNNGKWPLLEDDKGNAQCFDTEAARNNWIKERLREDGASLGDDEVTRVH